MLFSHSQQAQAREGAQELPLCGPLSINKYTASWRLTLCNHRCIKCHGWKLDLFVLIAGPTILMWSRMCNDRCKFQPLYHQYSLSMLNFCNKFSTNSTLKISFSLQLYLLRRLPVISNHLPEATTICNHHSIFNINYLYWETACPMEPGYLNWSKMAIKPVLSDQIFGKVSNT